MRQRFLLQIVDAANHERVLRLPSGGVLERELIDAVTDAAVKRGVGIFRTEATVKRAIAEGFEEVIRGLTKETRGYV